MVLVKRVRRSVGQSGAAPIFMFVAAWLAWWQPTAPAAVVWYSRFETEAGASVSDNQVISITAGAIDSQAGAGGNAYNADSAMTYRQYGQVGVPTMPSQLDPNGVIGSFIWSNPVPAVETTNRGIHTSVNSNILPGDYTGEAYFNLGEALVPAGSAAPRRLLTQRCGNSRTSRLAVAMGRSGAANDGSENVLVLYWRDAASAEHFAQGMTPIAQGEWHHFAVVVDKNDGTGLFNIMLYLDGQPEIWESNVSLRAMAEAEAYPFVLANYNGTQGASASFRGLIDEARISDTVLSPPELLMAAPNPSPQTWYSDFETEAGLPVSDRQVVSTAANAIDNQYYPLGGTAANPAGAGKYVQYGQVGVPAIPETMLKAAVTGSFAVLGDAGVSIDTLIRSDALSDYTVETFFNLGEAQVPAGSTPTRLFFLQRNGSGTTRLALGLARNPGNQNVLAVYDGSTLTLGARPVTQGSWHHVGMTVNAEDLTGTAEIRVYVDGVLDPAMTQSGVTLAAAGSATALVTGSGSSDGFVGLIDLVHIASQVLSPSEFLVRAPDSWYSTFETEAGAAVSHNQALSTLFGVIDNRDFATGGSAYNADQAARYVQYGQAGIPAIPAQIDVYALSAGYAVSQGSANGVNSNIISNSLDPQFTFEVFFNLGESQVPPGLNPTRLFLSQPGANGARVEFGLVQDAEGDNVLVLSAGGQVILGTMPVTSGEWHHAALAIDDTAGGLDLYGYLDGRADILIADCTTAVATNNDPVVLLGDGTGRGFVGLVDTPRLTNDLLLPGSFMNRTNRWYSRYETERGVAVTHDQAVSTWPTAIDNELDGPDGTAWNAESLVRYVAYGQAGVPAIPAALDPGGLAGQYAIRIPVTEPQNPADVGLATSTLIPSDSLLDYTVEGYFNLGEPAVPEVVPGTTQPLTRRFFTQRRTATASTGDWPGLESNGRRWSGGQRVDDLPQSHRRQRHFRAGHDTDPAE